ncbi:restriction endonuclease subunit S [Paenibacillus sp. GYB004]|uniref:restriction endonuclease subunit S n=1 Tax=Paenibacillus sp. GYB004 TaxID=2994393 RepID=UPI002F9612EB
MARGKKQSLSGAEELLGQAFVLEDEQPYEVPANWCWVRFHYLRESDTSFFDGDWILSENMDPNGNVRLIQLSDIGIGEFLDKSSKFISDQTFNELNCSQLREGDVLISRMAEPIARSCILPKLSMKCITAVDVAVMRCDTTIVSNKYVNYLCNTSWFTDLANNLARGTTRVRITRKNLGDLPVPLPPNAEQLRIVDRIESLFAKLDQAKELAQNALDSFEARKAAILHKAFTGELTAKWREEHNIGMDSWEETLFDFIIDSGPQNGLYKPKSAYGKGDKIVRIDSFYDGTINPWHSLKELSLDNNEIELYGLRNNDVIINRVNSMEYLGKSALVRKLEDTCVFESNIMRLTLKRSIAEPEYIIRYLNSTKGLTELRKNAKQAVNQASINQSDVRNCQVPLPSLLEQKEIVRILGRMLEREQEAKELVSVIDKIELMKKAVLARAFRGELGTNDPREQNALELLKEVLKS